ncbi:hypothetical protein DSECCO2_574020 [anaerobic digester metagenome]
MIVIQAVIPGQHRVFAERIREAELAAGGRLLEVVVGLVDLVDIRAHGQIGVVDARVGERQDTAAGLAAEHALELGVVALAEEVLLLDGAAEEHAVGGRVARAQADGAGVLVLDLDLDVHFARIVRGHGLDVDLFEVFELVQALVGTAQLGAREEVAVGQLDFAAHHVVAGLFVALDGHAAHVDLTALVDDVGQVDDLGVGMLLHVHVGFGEGIAVVGVEFGQGVEVVAHHGPVEVAALGRQLVELDAVHELGLVVEQVAGEGYGADLVAIALFHAEDDRDAVVAVDDLGLADLGVHEAAVGVIGLDGRSVALEHLVLEHAGTGDPGPEVAGGGGEFGLDVAGRNLLGPLDLDFLDVELLGLFDDDVEPGHARVGLLELVGDLGLVVALLAVELADLAQVVGQDLEVQDAAGLGAHGLENVVLFHVAVAGDADGLDTRLLLDHEGQALAAGDVVQAHLDVVEIAHVEELLDVFVDGLGVVGLVDLAFDLKQHHFLVEDGVALHVDFGDAVRGARGRNERRDLLGQFARGRVQGHGVFRRGEDRLGRAARDLGHPGVEAQALADLGNGTEHDVIGPRPRAQLAGG